MERINHKMKTMKKVIRLSTRDKKLMKLPTIKRFLEHMEREINKPKNLKEIEKRTIDLAVYGVSPAMAWLKMSKGLAGITALPPRKWFSLKKSKRRIKKSCEQ